MGFFNRLCSPLTLLADAQAFATDLANGPTFAHGMTKKMLQQEWNMGVDEAIEAEAPPLKFKLGMKRETKAAAIHVRPRPPK